MHRRILVVAALALGGCSLRLDTKELDPFGSLETFCQTLFDEFLVHERDCTGWTQQLVDYQYDRAVAMCASLGWSEGQGRIGYDRAAAQTCLSAVRHVPCSVNAELALMDECEAAIPGKRPNGADCHDDVECADPQASCKYLTAACPGTCLAPGQGGDPCKDGYPRCATGFYCDKTLASPACAPALADGQTCGTASKPCGENAYCTAAVGGTCVRYATEGERCDTVRTCLPGSRVPLFCDSYNQSPPVCRRILTVPLGGTCDSAEQCDLAGRCDLSNGSPGRCVERRGAGSPCLGDSMCARPLACVGDTAVGANGTCAPRATPGTICEPTSADCQIGAACMPAGMGPYTCQSWPSTIGGACGPHPYEKLCYVGQCGGTVEAPVCQPWTAAAQPCITDVECGPVGNFGGPRCELTAVSASPVCVPGCMGR